MDLAQAAKFFQRESFDGYDFLTQQWIPLDFKGQMKYAPESFGINDLSSRKRMLFTSKDCDVSSSVIRQRSRAQIFLVEGVQPDVYGESEYQAVYNVHQAAGPARLYRAEPIGPAENPGFAINSIIQDTFADVIFQRVPTDQESSVNQYGLYTVYMPGDCPAHDEDTLVIGGKTYFFFETYVDQGLLVARATAKPDLRVNIVYTAVTYVAYDPAQMGPSTTEVPFNVTAQIEPTKIEDTPGGNVLHDSIKVLIKRQWLGFAPKIDDKITVNGKTYLVRSITQNMVMDQWMLVASV